MKKSGFAAASMAVASAAAISTSSSPNFFSETKICHSHEESMRGSNNEISLLKRSNSEEQFAPRFDGLRFIETLVTAHR